MIVRAVYLISRSGLLLVQRVYGAVTEPPDSIMVSSFLTALLTFSEESVKQLAEAFDGSAATVTGLTGSNKIEDFTYGNLRFSFFEQDRVFLVLVVPRSSDSDILKPVGDRILEEFLTQFERYDFTLPDLSVYDSFNEKIDIILVSQIDLEPIEFEISYFQQLVTESNI